MNRSRDIYTCCDVRECIHMYSIENVLMIYLFFYFYFNRRDV